MLISKYGVDDCTGGARYLEPSATESVKRSAKCSEGVVQKYSSEGRKFLLTPGPAGWAWAVTTMDGEVEERGACPTKAAAAACIVRATVRRLAPVGHAACRR